MPERIKNETFTDTVKVSMKSYRTPRLRAAQAAVLTKTRPSLGYYSLLCKITNIAARVFYA